MFVLSVFSRSFLYHPKSQSPIQGTKVVSIRGFLRAKKQGKSVVRFVRIFVDLYLIYIWVLQMQFVLQRWMVLDDPFVQPFFDHVVDYGI